MCVCVYIFTGCKVQHRAYSQRYCNNYTQCQRDSTLGGGYHFVKGVNVYLLCCFVYLKKNKNKKN